jgi:hypothetical protein
MKEIVYDIHGLLGVRIRGLSSFALEAFNCMHSHFRTGSGAIREPDLSVEIGGFEPDLDGCSNVDHKYYVKPGYLFFRDSDKGLSWQAEILGLDRAGAGPLRVRYAAPSRNRLKFPWSLFPDLVLTLYVLNPLLELLLWRRGCHLLHSAAVEKDGKACLIAGRGGAHKTTFTMALLKRGWRLLGDDMVLLGPGRVLAFPTLAQELDYLVRHRETEELGILGRFGLFAHLAANRPPRIPIAASAAPAALNLVMVKDMPAPAVLHGWDRESLVTSLVANHLMEQVTYQGFKHSTAAFLEAYEYVFPEAGFRRRPAELAGTLRESFTGLPWRVLEVPHAWDARNMDLLLTGEGPDAG